MNFTTTNISIANRKLNEGYRLVRASIQTEEQHTTAKTIKGGILGYVEVEKPVIKDEFVPTIELSKDKGEKVHDIVFTTNQSDVKRLESKGYEVITEAEDNLRYQKFEHDSGLVIVRSSARTYTQDTHGYILAK
jgi:hypothetical protein